MLHIQWTSFFFAFFFQRATSTRCATVAEKSAECYLQLQLMSLVTAIFADSAQTFVIDQSARNASVPVLIVEVIASRCVGANISSVGLFNLFRYCRMRE